MAADYFLKIDGIDAGTGTDLKHKGEIQLDSFSWGVSNTVGPQGTGKASAHDFDFTAKSTIASPKLMAAAARGRPITGALMSVFTTGVKGTSTLLMKIKLTDILVSSYQNSANDAPTQPPAADDSPMDTVSLHYRRLDFTFGPVTESMDTTTPT